MRETARTDQCGFTLIEILVVIGILSALVVVLVPQLGSGDKAGRETETRARMLALGAMITAYDDVHGGIPPDDNTKLPRRQKQWEFGADNGKNSGIESLVMHLCHTPRAAELDQNPGWMANTDSDKSPLPLPGFDRKERLEVVDAWGTPLAYFTGANGSQYSGKQTIVLAAIDGQADSNDEFSVRPMRNPATSKHYYPRKYQLISAGSDKTFGTEDDLLFPDPQH